MSVFRHKSKGRGSRTTSRAGKPPRPSNGRGNRRIDFERMEDRTLLAVNFLLTPDAAYIAGTTLIPITIADGATTTSLADANLTVTFDSSLTARTVPIGWNNWGSPPNTESNSPRVLDSGAADNSVTLSFSRPLATFGLEMQQAAFSTLSLQADFFKEATFVAGLGRSITVPGAPGGLAADGAKLFGVNTPDEAITSVVLTAPAGAGGFALAQVRYALAQADLVVTKTVSTPQANPGDSLTYTINITNTGPNVAINPEINDTLPAGLNNAAFTFGTTPTGWVGVFNVGPGTLQYVGPDLAAGASATFTFSIPIAGGTVAGTNLVNTATGSSDTLDNDPSDDSGSATTLVVSPIVNVNGTAAGDNFRLVQNGASLNVFVNNVLTTSQLLNTIDQVLVNGLAGNDTLTVDNSNGLLSFVNGIDFAGGNDNDLLIVTGNPGGINSATYTPGAAADAGTIFVDGVAADQTITFSGLEPIEFLMPVPLLTVNGTAGANTLNFIQDGLSVAPDPITLAPALTYELNYNGAFELIRFRNAATFTLNAGNGNDTITMNVPTKLDAALTTINLNGQIDSDIVQILATPAGVTTNVDTGPGIPDDTYIGVTAANYDTGVGSLNAISGVVNVNDSGGFVNLLVDDSGDVTGDIITITATSITGASPAAINYQNGNIEGVEFLGGTGNDNYNILSTQPFDSTLVADYGGVNTWQIAGDGLGTASDNKFLGGPDDDTFTLDAGTGLLANSVLIDGGAGGNDVTVIGTPFDDGITASWFGPGQYDVSGLGTVVNLLNATFATIDGAGGFNSLLLEDASNGVLAIGVAPQSADSVLVDIANFGTPNFAGQSIGFFTVDGDSDGSGDQDLLAVLGTSTSGNQSFFEATSPDGSDFIFVSDSYVDIYNTVLGQLLPVNIVTAGFTDLILLAGNEDPQIGDTITAVPSVLLELFIEGDDPTLPANPGDTLNVNTIGDATIFNDPILGPVNYVIEDSAGGGTLFFSEIETINVTPGSGVLNLKGDRFDTFAQDDLFVVVGTGPNAGTARINDPLLTEAAINFSGVDTLRVFGYELADTLDITPFANNTPQNWDVEVYFDEGDSPILTDLLIYNGVAGVSENIVVQPSGALAGQVIVTQAVNNFPVVTINYIANLGIEVNANDATLGDTDQLFLRDATGSPPTTNGNATVNVDLGAAGGPLAPLVTVSDGLAGLLYQIEGLTNFNAINIQLGDGDDIVNLLASPAITANIDAGAGNDVLDATGSLIGVSLSGGPGNDVIIGGDGPDLLFGGDGGDVISGGLGNDIINGGAGQDFIDPGLGFNLVDGGEGQDWLQLLDFPLDSFSARAAGSDLLIEYGAFEGVMAANIDAAYIQFSQANPNPVSAFIEDLSTTALDAFLIDLPGNDVADLITIQGRNIADNISLAIETIAPSLIPLTTVTLAWGKVSLGLGETQDGDIVAVEGLGGDDVIKAAPEVTFGPSASTFLVSLTGGAGDDYLSGDATLVGSDGDDTLVGSPGDDSLDGGAGNDLLHGLAGNDTLLGGDGEDTLDGGTGSNVVNGGAGFDIIPVLGTDGPDVVSVVGPNNALVINVNGVIGTNDVTNVEQIHVATYGGDDNITLGAAIASLVETGTGNDVVNGATGTASSLIYGGDGNDIINGTQANDTIYGGAGNDVVTGDGGVDQFFGEADSDTFIWLPGDGDDLFEGGTGEDTLVFEGSGGNEVFTISAVGTRVLFQRNLGLIDIDMADVETIDLDTKGGADAVTVNDLTLTATRLVSVDLTAAEGLPDLVTVFGRELADNLLVSSAAVGSAQVEGLAYNVVVTGAEGLALDVLRINGVGGNDTLKAAAGVETSIGIILDGGAGDDYLSADATLFGGDGDDTLIGGAGNDSLDGGAGNDTLFGGPGNDTLLGGDGQDTLDGGTGLNIVNGGAGFDVIPIVGTDGPDIISAIGPNAALVITVNGAAGTNNVTSVELLRIDALEGDDAITLLSTTPGIPARVDAGEGNDSVIATGTTASVTILGGDGEDLLIGGDVADRIEGGDGNDSIQGGLGNDSLFGDNGSDTFTSTFLDGNDTVEGGEGDDIAIFAGSPTVANDFKLDNLGTRALATVATGVNSASINSADVEQYNLIGGTGGDEFDIQDLWLTDVILVNINTSGTNAPDAANDCICVNGRNVGDDMTALIVDDEVHVEGLKAQVNIANSTNNAVAVDTLTLYGNAGDDRIAVIPPVETRVSVHVFGGFGDDKLTGGSQMAGGADNDTLIGTNGPDTLVGGPGDDSIVGLGGNDLLLGDADIALPPPGSCCGPFDIVPILEGFGDDTIEGGNGNDTINGDGGDDLLFGGSGDDLIGIITVGPFTFLEPGNDTVLAGSGNDTVFSDTGDDVVLGGDGHDLIFAGADNDTVFGERGNDTIYGGTGDDVIGGNEDNDTLLGEEGNDTITGDAGNDAIDGGFGDDSLSGGTGNDSILGRAGNDTILGDAGSDSLFGGTGNDSMSGGTDNDTLCGEEGDDALAGDEGNDLLLGGTDNDSILGGDGVDTIFGGAGNDQADGGAGNDFLMGGIGNDTLLGGDGNDWMFGNEGNDLLVGGFGNDTLVGGIGDDSLHGGNGVFRLPHAPIPHGLPDDGDDWLIGEDGFDKLDAGNGNNFLDAGFDNYRETLLAGPGNDQGFIHSVLGPLADVAALDGGHNIVHHHGLIQPPPSPIEPPCSSIGLSVFTISTVPGIDSGAIVAGLTPPVIVANEPVVIVPVKTPKPPKVVKPAKPRVRVPAVPASRTVAKPTASNTRSGYFSGVVNRRIP